jgi:hypothetical protein
MLPSSLCAVIPKALSALVAPVFIKGSASATIYELVNGVKGAVDSGAAMSYLAAPNSPVYESLTDAFVASVPTGPNALAPGELVKGSNSANVYIVDGSGGIIPLTAFSTVSDMGLSTSYTIVSPATISSLTASSTALTNLVSCGGTTYLAAGGKLTPLPSGVVGSLAIEMLPSSLCAVIPKALSALVAPVFIKGSASATIYELANGAKTQMQSFAQMSSLAAPNSPVYESLTDAFVMSITAP